MKKRIACIAIVIFLLIAFGATVTIDWLYDTFGHLSMDEIIFHLKVPKSPLSYNLNSSYYSSATVIGTKNAPS